MKKHLKDKHQINENAAQEHLNWISHNYVTLNWDDTKKLLQQNISM